MSFSTSGAANLIESGILVPATSQTPTQADGRDSWRNKGKDGANFFISEATFFEMCS